MPRCLSPPFEFTTSGQCASRGSWRRAPRKGNATTMTIAESPANSGVIERGPESATISSASPALPNGQRHDGEEHGS